MLNNLVSLISKSLSQTGASAQIAPTSKTKSSYNNPFAQSAKNVNPFLSVTFGSSPDYGKNKPVAGGYYAGEYNGKPNIVGRKLFIEV